MSNKKTDIDYTTSAVDKSGRKSNLSMFMIMLGFTFFSASMWVGQQLAAGLNWSGFVWALILGGLILAAYTGAQAGLAPRAASPWTCCPAAASAPRVAGFPAP